MLNILVVVDGTDDDEHVLGQAVKFAAETGGDVHVFMSVYDPVEELNKYIGFDDYPQVKEAILEEAEIKLRVLAEKFAEAVTSNMAWGRHWHLNVLAEAERMESDLIIKAVGKHSRIAEFLQTPEDWHLLRESRCPVWLVNKTTTHIDKVVAAFSAMDETVEHRLLASRVVDKARDFAAALKVKLHVVTVIPDLARTQALLSRVPMGVAGVQASARERAQKLLSQSLDELGIQADEIEVRCGSVDEELASVVGDNGLLLIGSVANRGISGKLIGNTSEKVLHYLTGDVVVVH